MNDWLPRYLQSHFVEPALEEKGQANLRSFLKVFAHKADQCFVNAAESWGDGFRKPHLLPDEVRGRLAVAVTEDGYWGKKPPVVWNLDWEEKCRSSRLPSPFSDDADLASALPDWSDDVPDAIRQFSSQKVYFSGLLVEMGSLQASGLEDVIESFQHSLEVTCPRRVAAFRRAIEGSIGGDMDWQLSSGTAVGTKALTQAHAEKLGLDAPTRKSQLEKALMPVWFATNRAMTSSSDPKSFFGKKRANTVTLGKVEVHIPQSHKFGELGSRLFKRLLPPWKPDDRLVVKSIRPLDELVFWTQIRERVHLSKEYGESESLIYIHGYNVSFYEAARRAAQLARDLAVNGPTAFFSWPSKGRLEGYLADTAAVLESENFLKDFLEGFASTSGADKIHIIAHSMGNRALLAALDRLVDRFKDQPICFSQIILAAPDVDKDTFLRLARNFRSRGERVTLYSCNRDWALAVSKFFHAFPRAGHHEPYTFAPGVDTISVPNNFRVDLLGHSYYAESAPLLCDIYNLMKNGDAPPRRQQKQFERGSDIGWEFMA